MKNSEQLLDQIDDVLIEYEQHNKRVIHLSEVIQIQIVTRIRAALVRICTNDSVYIRQAEEIIKAYSYPADQADFLYGILKSLRADLEAGYIENITELLHGELFSDFIEMSEHLQKEGYKDAAAVIAGSTLEAHLRQLCIKNGIKIEDESKGKIKPKKADRMNSDLAKANAYSKGDQKNVTAWLDLRNDAAHGQYKNYSDEQVAITITAIRDFLTRNPA
ncbi:MAG: hypothetical protein WBB48_09030 [Thermodesulfobacteriota bacterium]